MSTSGGSRGSHGSRGRVPLPVRQHTRGSSPASSDGTTGHRYTSGRHVMTRGGFIGHTTGPSRNSGVGDVMADMDGVFRQRLNSIPDDDDYDVDLDVDLDVNRVSDPDIGDEDDDGLPSQHESNYGDGSHTSNKPPANRVGAKFGCNSIHSSICGILHENINDSWITYRKIPKEVKAKMFKNFATTYTLDPTAERSNYEAFINVQKDRYRDILHEFKVQATINARLDGHEIAVGNYKEFNIIRDYCPKGISESVWRGMCQQWDNIEWRKKSECGARNRASADSGGKTSRHTGGSIGYDEHRIRLKKIWGKDPTYRELFLYTHLDKESKTKLLARELNINGAEGMVFITDKSKAAYEAYLKEMREVYGSNFTTDDPDVWLRVQGGGKRTRVFGIGSSDLNYVVTGTPSSSYGTGPSYTDYMKAQEKIQYLEARFESEKQTMESRFESEKQTMESRFEAEKQTMVALVASERQEREESQRRMQESFKKEMEEFMRKLSSSR